MDLRIAAYCLIVDGDAVLLAHWNEGGRSGWTLPGGGLEAGEHPEAAAIREVAEETGYEVELLGVLGVDSVIVPADHRFAPNAGTPLQGIRIVYSARVVAGDLTNERDGSTDMAAWHARREIPSLNHVSLVDYALGFLD